MYLVCVCSIGVVKCIMSTSELCLESGQECDQLKEWILLPLWLMVLAFPVNSC